MKTENIDVETADTAANKEGEMSEPQFCLLRKKSRT